MKIVINLQVKNHVNKNTPYKKSPIPYEKYTSNKTLAFFFLW